MYSSSLWGKYNNPTPISLCKQVLLIITSLQIEINTRKRERERNKELVKTESIFSNVKDARTPISHLAILPVRLLEPYERLDPLP